MTITPFLLDYHTPTTLSDNNDSRVQLWSLKLESGLKPSLPKMVVVKTIQANGKNVKKDKDGYPMEYRNLKNIERFQHDRIIKYFGAEFCGSEANLYFEHCEVGNLEQYRKHRESQKLFVAEAFIWMVLKQLSEAVAFLHTGYGCKQVSIPWGAMLHLDITPRNILLQNGPDNMLQIKLCNFGKAVRESEALTVNALDYVNPLFLPPEAISVVDPALEDTSPPAPTRGYDMWAIGAVMHYLAVGFAPVDMVTISSNPNVHRQDPELHRTTQRLSVPISYDMWHRNDAGFFSEIGKPWDIRYSDGLGQKMVDCLVHNPAERVDAMKLVKGMEEAIYTIEQEGYFVTMENAEALTFTGPLPRDVLEVVSVASTTSNSRSVESKSTRSKRSTNSGVKKTRRRTPTTNKPLRRGSPRPLTPEFDACSDDDDPEIEAEEKTSEESSLRSPPSTNRRSARLQSLEQAGSVSTQFLGDE